MQEITFWSLESINHSPHGRLMLPSGPLGLMALCVFGFGFLIFHLNERYFLRFLRIIFSCIFSSLTDRFFGFLVKKFCLEFFLFFPLKG